MRVTVDDGGAGAKTCFATVMTGLDEYACERPMRICTYSFYIGETYLQCTTSIPYSATSKDGKSTVAITVLFTF